MSERNNYRSYCRRLRFCYYYSRKGYRRYYKGEKGA